MYPVVYDKVVTSGITPTVPINLKDITRSCVEGWKREGQWPPQPTAPEPGKKMGRIKGLGLLKGRRDSGNCNPGLGMVTGSVGGEGRRGSGSLASVFGLDKVKNILARRGSGSRDRGGSRERGEGDG